MTEPIKQRTIWTDRVSYGSASQKKAIMIFLLTY